MFDLKKPEDFFYYIKITIDRSESNGYRLSDLLFLIMSLNHLREWIAPGYNKYKNQWPEANTKEKEFSKFIYETEEFKLIRKLCNGTKHLSSSTPSTHVKFNDLVMDWKDISEVRDISKGYPTNYFVEDKDIGTILSSVVNMYEEWFKRGK